MKLEKKHWVIIGVIVAIIVIWYLFFKKKKSESGYSVGRGYDPGQNLLLYHGRPLVGESGYAMSGPVTNRSIRFGSGKMPVERHMPSGNKTCSCYINGYWTRWDCKTPCPETT